MGGRGYGFATGGPIVSIGAQHLASEVEIERTGMLFMSGSASTAALVPTAHAARRHIEDQVLENHIVLWREGWRVQPKTLEQRTDEIKMTVLRSAT